MENKLLTVIIPSFNEEDIIEKTIYSISNILDNSKIPYELLFIDDGSSDKTWDKITTLSQTTSNINGIRFSRNFGKDAAIFAGLEYAKGDCVVLIDCDLQHPPEKIIDMYKLWESGYEVVEGIKESRGKEFFLHTMAADCFYKIISKTTGIDMANASDFKLLDRKVVNALLKLNERNIFFRALSSWVGFKRTHVKFEVQERTEGSSKWSIKSLIKYALSNIAEFSSAPMQIVSILGSILFIVSIIFGGIALYQKFTGVASDGFTTVILLLLFIGSILMISLGIIGYYLAKIYDEIKGRPRFIISELVDEVENE